MPYPNNNENDANTVPLNPALHSSALNGLLNAEQAFQVVDKMSGIGDSRYFNLITSEPTALGAAPVTTILRVLAATYLHAGYLYNNSAADGDIIDVDIIVPSAGTWRLALNAPVNINNGILKLFIDGVQIGVAGGYDLYAAALDPLPTIIVAGLVLTAGKKTLRFKVDGKNGASGGFQMHLSGVSYRRTA